MWRRSVVLTLVVLGCRGNDREPDKVRPAAPAVAPADAARAVAPVAELFTAWGAVDGTLPAWQGAWATPQPNDLHWGAIEVRGTDITLSFQDDSWRSGTIVGVAPCGLLVHLPAARSESDEVRVVPAVFAGGALHTGTAVVVRRGDDVLACGQHAMLTIEHGTCRIWEGPPPMTASPATCRLEHTADGDVFIDDHLSMTLTGDVTFGDRPPAVRAKTLAEAKTMAAQNERDLGVFVGPGVPVGIGAIRLGDRNIGWLTGEVADIAGAHASADIYSDRRGVQQIAVYVEADWPAVIAALTARMGPPTPGAGPPQWDGPNSSLIMTDANPFSGAVGPVLVIVPAGDTHVCGRADGFAPFYKAFIAALRKRDYTAVAAMMTYPQRDWDDSEGADMTVIVKDREDFVANATAVFPDDLRRRIIARGLRPADCILRDRAYIAIYGDQRLSPAVYVSLGDDGAWRITSVGHAPHDLH